VFGDGQISATGLHRGLDGRGAATIGPFSGFLPANLAIAAGKGNGSSREYKEYGEIATTGLERREMFVDAGESADELEM